MEIRKEKGKCVPIKITRDILKRIHQSKLRLQEMKFDSEISEEYKSLIDIILSLDDYDLNLLLGFYEIGDESPSQLSKVIGITPNIIINRIKKITKNVRTQFTTTNPNHSLHN